MTQTFNLERFLDAQNSVYESVLEELRYGRKHGHWMWFIFPQIKGLGSSEMSRHFSISSNAEACQYLEHSVLGSRLRECTDLVLDVEGRSSQEIFGFVDSKKFKSCMTLFDFSTNHSSPFRQALLKYFDGKMDESTLKILNEM